MKYKAVLVVMVLCLSLSLLSACGKRGTLEPVKEGIYPKTYPGE